MRPADHAEDAVRHHARGLYLAKASVGKALLDHADHRIRGLTVDRLHVPRPFRSLVGDVGQVFPDIDIEQRVVLAVGIHERGDHFPQFAGGSQVAVGDAPNQIQVALDHGPDDFVEQFLLGRDVVIQRRTVDLHFLRHRRNRCLLKSKPVEHAHGRLGDFLAPVLVGDRIGLRCLAALLDYATFAHTRTSPAVVVVKRSHTRS